MHLMARFYCVATRIILIPHLLVQSQSGVLDNFFGACSLDNLYLLELG